MSEKIKEIYTVITSDLTDPLIMRLEIFNNRETMREFLLTYVQNHKRCIVIPGIVDDVDYQVEYEDNEETIKTLHFEDEADFKPFFGLLDVSTKQTKE